MDAILATTRAIHFGSTLLIFGELVFASFVARSALAIAGAYLALPALAGHAAGGQGAERYLRLGADMLHLLAAGAWVGALPALARLFVTARRSGQRASLELAAQATRRFSALGTLS